MQNRVENKTENYWRINFPFGKFHHNSRLIFDHAIVAKQRVQKWFPQEAATGKHNNNIGFRMEKWPDTFRSEAKLSQMEPRTKIQKL